MSRIHRPLSAGIAALALLAACGDDTDSTTTTTPSAASGATTAGGSETDTAAAGLSVVDAWARTSPAMASAGAVYMTIINGGDTDDALVGASVDPSVAGTVEVHETVAATMGTTMGSDMGTTMGSDMGSDMGTATTAMGSGSMADHAGTMPGGGMMQMQPVDRIDIPAGGQAVLEPGGYHIMLLDLAAPLELGSKIAVTLDFDQAADMTLDVEVRESAP